MRFQIRKRGGRGIAVDPEYTQIGNDTIVGAASWLEPDGRRSERFQVLTVQHGKIVDMQGFTSRRAAMRFARRH